MIEVASFTDRGYALALRLAQSLGGRAWRVGGDLPLAQWTHQHFSSSEALVFVGATGIAVRAIAPHIVHKAQDPAVVVVDERANFAISLLSGHLGGANALCERVAHACGATAVITTATDVNGVFAVDTWASCNGCAVANPQMIKKVSAKLLAGNIVSFASDWQISGEAPQGVEPAESAEDCDFTVSLTPCKNALNIIPRIVVLGVGCRRDTPASDIERSFLDLMRAANIAPEAVSLVCSIDVKADEAGLLEFCRTHGLPFKTFSAQELSEVPGAFKSSSFVASTVGVDNVCERAAVAGSSGEIIVGKTTGNGTAMALAIAPFKPKWSN